MRFKTTVTFTYEIPDEKLKEYYGTTDKHECAKIDQNNVTGDPTMDIAELMDSSDEISVFIEPIE